MNTRACYRHPLNLSAPAQPGPTPAGFMLAALREAERVVSNEDADHRSHLRLLDAVEYFGQAAVTREWEGTRVR